MAVRGKKNGMRENEIARGRTGDGTNRCGH